LLSLVDCNSSGGGGGSMGGAADPKKLTISSAKGGALGIFDPSVT